MSKLADQLKALYEEKARLQARLQEIDMELASISQVVVKVRQTRRLKAVSQQMVLEAVQEHGPIKTIALAEKFGWTTSVVAQHLSRLKALGKVTNDDDSKWSLVNTVK